MTDIGSNTQGLAYYQNLLTDTYDKLITELNKKHGKVRKNYCNSKAFSNYMETPLENKKRKLNHLKSAKYRTKGLYLHHIREDIYPNLSNPDRNASHYPDEKRPSYEETQLNDKLVYANLIEHIILHAMISRNSPRQNNTDNGFNSLLGIASAWYKDYPPLKESVHVKKGNDDYYAYMNSYLTPDEFLNLKNELLEFAVPQGNSELNNS